MLCSQPAGIAEQDKWQKSRGSKIAVSHTWWCRGGCIDMTGEDKRGGGGLYWNAPNIGPCVICLNSIWSACKSAGSSKTGCEIKHQMILGSCINLFTSEERRNTRNEDNKSFTGWDFEECFAFLVTVKWKKFGYYQTFIAYTHLLLQFISGLKKSKVNPTRNISKKPSPFKTLPDLWLFSLLA